MQVGGQLKYSRELRPNALRAILGNKLKFKLSENGDQTVPDSGQNYPDGS